MVQRDTEDTALAQELAQQVREATRQIAVLTNETSYRWRMAKIPVRHVIDSSRNSCLTDDLTGLRNCRNAALPAHCTPSLRHDNLAAQLVNWQRRQPTALQRC